MRVGVRVRVCVCVCVCVCVLRVADLLVLVLVCSTTARRLLGCFALFVVDNRWLFGEDDCDSMTE